MRSAYHYSDDGSGVSLRQIIDLIICLVITVSCARTFIVEGYMISTGSMAPSLLGYHKRVVCPLCQTPFELGVDFDEADGFVSENPDDPTHSTCPNCGEDEIDIRSVPKTQGDQLLVHKNVFSLRDPDRWEVVVFSNPALATEAYVKRVIGRPRESVQVKNGDVFINGERARKNLAQCLATEITVYDDSRRPTDSEWRSRWTVGKAWEQTESGFISAGVNEWSWVRYRHWLRSGGNHRSEASIDATQLAAARRSISNGDGFGFVTNDLVEFDELRSKLRIRGVMSEELRNHLRAASSDAKYRAAVNKLAARSHLAPIQDNYGYNWSRPTKPVIVRDVGAEMTISSDQRAGEFVVQLEAPTDTFEIVFNLETGDAQLFGHENGVTLQSGRFAPSALSQGAVIAVRQTDGQLLVTFNGEQVFETLVLPEGDNQKMSHEPIAFAAHGASVSVSGVRITRDIHYTEDGRNGVDEEFVLGDEEYFVLGDNSPRSSDSRKWANAPVHKSYLIGKPVIVHLPSSPKALKFGSNNYLIRIPEFSKIRYIR